MVENGIESMSKNKLKSILNTKILLKAKEYLYERRGSKGSEILYEYLEMSNYLAPNDSGLSIDDKKLMWSIRNRMVNIPSNFPGKININMKNECITGCKKFENMEHIYNCLILNKKSQHIMEDRKYSYQDIFQNNLTNQIEVFRVVKENIEQRNVLLEKQSWVYTKFHIKCMSKKKKIMEEALK